MNFRLFSRALPRRRLQLAGSPDLQRCRTHNFPNRFVGAQQGRQESHPVRLAARRQERLLSAAGGGAVALRQRQRYWRSKPTSRYPRHNRPVPSLQRPTRNSTRCCRRRISPRCRAICAPRTFRPLRSKAKALAGQSGDGGCRAHPAWRRFWPWAGPHVPARCQAGQKRIAEVEGGARQCAALAGASTTEAAAAMSRFLATVRENKMEKRLDEMVNAYRAGDGPKALARSAGRIRHLSRGSAARKRV